MCVLLVYYLITSPNPMMSLMRLQKHEDAVKRVAGPSRTGKARTKAARALKRKLNKMAADGTITQADFEMADAEAEAELAADKVVAGKTKAVGLKVGAKKKTRAVVGAKSASRKKGAAATAGADNGIAAMDE
jgi:hypothetical protein